MVSRRRAENSGTSTGKTYIEYGCPQVARAELAKLMANFQVARRCEGKKKGELTGRRVGGRDAGDG